MESLTGRTEPVSIEGLPQLFEDARSLLFTNFPIYDENHRFVLENLIMGRYLTREIAFTPFAIWKFKFNQKLAEIMPYYNELYKVMADISNPFDDVNYERTIKTDKSITQEKGTTDTTESNSNTTNTATFTPGTTSIDTAIETPQTELESFLQGKYMSSANKSYMEGEDNTVNVIENGGKGTVTHTGQDVDTEDNLVVEKMKGKRSGKTYMELMVEYREKIINIDNMILDELEELFFMVY